ncbi:UDP-N-acetylglucosamine diphosphorylase 1 [Linum grandiflorum]
MDIACVCVIIIILNQPKYFHLWIFHKDACSSFLSCYDYYTRILWSWVIRIDIKGTRLGSDDPKGCFNIGLPSGKSLFQLQAERILCVQRLAAHEASEGSGGSAQIHWYIMTSPFTDESTRKFFEWHKYFGLEADQVTFFQQGTIPSVANDGRFIMETPYRVCFCLVPIVCANLYIQLFRCMYKNTYKAMFVIVVEEWGICSVDCSSDLKHKFVCTSNFYISTR